MRKLIVVMALIGLFVSVVQAANALETAVGRVDSVSPISPETGTAEGSVIIVDAAGNELSFTINTNTVVLDESANKIDSDDIVDGDNVNISYSKSDMGNIAATISRVRK